MYEYPTYVSIGLVSVLVIVLGVYVRAQRSRRSLKYAPSLPWLPVVGSLPFMTTTAAQIPRFFLDKTKSLGNIFAFYSGSRYAIVLNGRKSIHEALVKKSVDFAGRRAFYAWDKYVLTEQYRGVVFRQYDEKFKRLHNQTLTILKEFGFGKLLMETRILAEVSELIKHIKEMKGNAFDPEKLISSTVMNIIYSITFGNRLETMGSKVDTFVKMVHNIVKTLVPELDVLPQLRFIPSFRKRMMKNVSITKQFTEYLADELSKTLDAEVVPESFVRSFTAVDDDRFELVVLCRDLMMAGSKTSTTTIRWGLLLLANHPDIQDRLHKEIDSVVPKERLPNLDDRTKLSYVEASILELLRYKTLVPLAAPHQTTCDTEVEGYFIPKDTMVIVNLYSAHMDAAVWKDPDVFRPERFLDDRGNVVNKEAVIPFSLGKRSCLGELLARQEVFLLFTGLLQQFDICPPEGQEQIEYDEILLVTQMPSPYDVRLVSREFRRESGNS